ncbi:hypothetical protein HPC38_04370 [Pasteurellaceae bacterium HPA106]|nr:hypothetical protein [Spirabiliibacterium pneumoniae]
MYIFNYEGDDTSNPLSSGNVDGFWWEDSSNTIYFQGDRPHKSKTDLRTTLKAKEFETENGKKLSEVITIDDLVGIPIPYPKTSVPSSYLAMNGQRFSTSRYPKLAKLYPTGQLSDLRGEFIRGWDNGRGIDRGRSILSSQGFAIKNITGRLIIRPSYYERSHNAILSGGASGVFDRKTRSDGDSWNPNTVNNTTYQADVYNFDASRVVPTADETRPRNISFQYICLAG